MKVAVTGQSQISMQILSIQLFVRPPYPNAGAWVDKTAAGGPTAAFFGFALPDLPTWVYCTRLGVTSAGMPLSCISRARAATLGITAAIRSSSRSAATPG